MWLAHPTPEAVADARDRTGLPVGVTVADLEALADLVAAGAVAVEAADLPAGITWPEGLVNWCAPAQAHRALDDGVPAERIIVERIDAAGPGFTGATVPGEGPTAWGAILARVEAGVRVVRTQDPRSVRRVVTVADRLLEARAAALAGAAS